MSDKMEFEGKDKRDAVRKACEAHLVEPKMLKYEIVEEREAAATRFSRSTGYCKIRVISAEVIADDLPDAPPGGGREDRGPRRDGRGDRRDGRGGRGGRGDGRGDRQGRSGRGSDRDRGPRRDRDGRGRSDGERRPRPPMDPEAAAVSAEKAVETVNALLGKMGFEAELSTTEGDDWVRVDLNCEDPDLTAEGGEIFDSIQHLTNIVVCVRGGGKRVYIDANGAQRKREEEMVAMAHDLAEKVKQDGEMFKLEPMSSGDRRFIHRALNDVEGVSTRSEGEGAFRHLLIVPEQAEMDTEQSA